MQIKHLIRLTTGAGLMKSLAAAAIPIVFTVSGGDSASWTIDSDAKPYEYDFDASFGQTIFNANVVFGGVARQALVGFSYSSDGSSYFFASDNDDNTQTAIYGNVVQTGSSLFTGPVYAPVFQPGVYAISTTTVLGGPYKSSVLTISVVPEPSTAASLLAGLVLLGAIRVWRKTGANASLFEPESL